MKKLDDLIEEFKQQKEIAGISNRRKPSLTYLAQFSRSELERAHSPVFYDPEKARTAPAHAIIEATQCLVDTLAFDSRRGEALMQHREAVREALRKGEIPEHSSLELRHRRAYPDLFKEVKSTEREILTVERNESKGNGGTR